MKNKHRTLVRRAFSHPNFGIIAVIAVIVFSMIACASMSIVSVDWDSLKGPEKTRQYLGVSSQEVTVFANYKDESRKEVTFLSASHDKDKTGTQTVTVTVMGQGSGTFETEVMEMTDLRIERPPSKTTYKVGDKADLAGIKVMGSWSDLPDAEIPTYQVTVSSFDSSSAGNKLVTVNFKGKTATFPVTVTAAAASAAPAASAASAAPAPAATTPAASAPAASAPASSTSSSWVATTAHPFPTTGTFNGISVVAYGNNKWIAGGSQGRLASSTDGITWTEVTANAIAGGGNDISTIAYDGKGRWVAAGWSGKMATSTDNGVTWTAVTNHPFTWDTPIKGVAYGNNRWVAVGRKAIVAYSDNGTTGTAVANSTFPAKDSRNNDFDIQAVAYGNNRWVAVGRGIATSTNGITWTEGDKKIFGDNPSLYGIAWGNNKFVTVGYGGKIAYSPTGQ
jgi:hypothetical protein